MSASSAAALFPDVVAAEPGPLGVVPLPPAARGVDPPLLLLLLPKDTVPQSCGRDWVQKREFDSVNSPQGVRETVGIAPGRSKVLHEMAYRVG